MLELAIREGSRDELRRRLFERTGGRVNLAGGTATKVLAAIEEDGGIEVLQRIPRQGRPRVVYGLTDAGRAEAEEARAEMLLALGEGVAPPAGGEADAGEPEADEAPARPERIVVLDEDADEEEGG